MLFVYLFLIFCVSPWQLDGEVQGELTLGPEQVCFADHFFHSAASILTEMCLATNVAAEDYRLGRTMVFLNARAYQTLTSVKGAHSACSEC